MSGQVVLSRLSSQVVASPATLENVMADGVSVTFMVYGNAAQPQTDGLMRDACAWLATNSKFVPIRQVRKVAQLPSTLVPDNAGCWFLSPRHVDWSVIPQAQFVILLWDNRPHNPNYYGGTWGVGAPDYGHWRNQTDACAVMSIPVACAGNGWSPGGGGTIDGIAYPNYSSNYCSTTCHELCHGIASWINDYYGYKIAGLYSLHPPEVIHIEGHNRFLNQITDKMYADMLRHDLSGISPTSASP